MCLLKKMKLGMFALFASMMVMVGTAQAAIDTTASDTLFAEITADITYLQGKAWTIVFLIVGIMISIGLFKKFTSKAAG